MKRFLNLISLLNTSLYCKEFKVVKENSTTAFLWKIEIKEEYRNQSIGTHIMNQLIQIANKCSVDITLVPTPYDLPTGTNYKEAKKRLMNYYRRFGFIRTGGKYCKEQMTYIHK